MIEKLYLRWLIKWWSFLLWVSDNDCHDCQMFDREDLPNAIKHYREVKKYLDSLKEEYFGMM